MKIIKISLISLMMLSLLWMGNVAAIQISVSSDDSTVSTNYMLSDDAALRDEVSIFDGGTVVNRAARGTGSNSISTNVGGDDYSAGTAVYSSGQFSLSSSLIAAGNGALISQDTGCSGDAGAEIYGIANGGAAGQQAAVLNGRLSSLQSLAVGGGALASQDTAADGEGAFLQSSAVSASSIMDMSGGFSGENGNTRANLHSSSVGDAFSWGEASINDINCFDQGLSQKLQDNGLNMYMDGLYDAGDGTEGSFGFSVSKLNTVSAVSSSSLSPSASSSATYELASSGLHPEIYARPRGDPNAFVVIENRKIDETNPLQLYLKIDASLTNENLDPDAVNEAVSLAANTWDYWTDPDQNNLFMSNVINDESKATDVQDGYSVNAFKPISGTSTLAYARVYTDQYGYVREADICYNTNRVWTTDYYSALISRTGLLDFQTVALHELGHVVGLGDLYTLPITDSRSKDYREIMNSYTHPQHFLGPGDINGVQTIYGA